MVFLLVVSAWGVACAMWDVEYSVNGMQMCNGGCNYIEHVTAEPKGPMVPLTRIVLC